MSVLHDKKLKELEILANQLREEVIDMVSLASSGHVAGPLGMADIFACLYGYVMKYNHKEPLDPNRDRLVLSNGHICPILYAALAYAGFFPKSELKTLRRLHSRLQGHPHRGTLPGIETSSGPLGSGLSQACGIAYGARLLNKKFRTFCITSDGEHQEGNHMEAMMLAGHYKLSNLVCIIDRNNIQIDGYTENIMRLEPLSDKYRAFNWHVIEINGHNIREFADACMEAEAIYEKPTVIIAHTIPGKGIKDMEYDYKWHSKLINKEDSKKFLKELRTLKGKIKKED